MSVSLDELRQRNRAMWITRVFAILLFILALLVAVDGMIGFDFLPRQQNGKTDKPDSVAIRLC